MSIQLTDEFCSIIELCGKFQYQITEHLFACLKHQSDGKFTMKQLIKMLPENDRRLIAQVFLGYCGGYRLIGCTKEEVEKAI